MAWAPSRRTGTATYKRWRLAVMARDRYQCQRCGYQGSPHNHDVEADHIVNVAAGGTDELSNGQCLCVPCHTAKTKGEQDAGRQARSGRRQPPRHPSDAIAAGGGTTLHPPRESPVRHSA